MDSTEPTGATPLPLTSAGSPVRVWLDDHGVPADQPQATRHSLFPATRYDDVINGSLVSSNAHFIVYVAKNGLLRVLYKGDSNTKTTATTLMRGHTGQRVTDVQFFQQQGDVFCSVASPDKKAAPASNVSSLIVSRASYDKKKIAVSVEMLLELRTQHFCMWQLKWHALNMNQLCLIHTDATGAVVGTLLNTETISVDSEETRKVGHNLCLFHSAYCIKPGVVQVKDMKPSNMGNTKQSNLTDFAWADSPYRVLSTHDSGRIILWDWENVTARPDGYMAPTPLVTIQEHSPVTRCLFLPHAQSSKLGKRQGGDEAITPCFLTASNHNADVTLWSSFTADHTLPTKLQVFGLERPSASYSLNVCFFGGVETSLRSVSPPSTFAIMADRMEGKIFAWHLSAAVTEAKNNTPSSIYLNGCDYVVPFACKHATFSGQVGTQQSAQVDDENEYDDFGMCCDIVIDAYQSAAVQTLTIRSIQLLPPTNSWTDPTPAVRVERLWPDAHSTHVSEVGSEEGMQYDEEYDLAVDDDGGDEYDEDSDGDNGYGSAPDASALPTPMMNSPRAAPAPAVSNNAFSNWLGTLASKDGVLPVVPPPIATTVSSVPVASLPIVASGMPFRADTPPTSNRRTTDDNNNNKAPVSNKASGSKKGKKTPPRPSGPPSSQGVSILQRSSGPVPDSVVSSAPPVPNVPMPMIPVAEAPLVPNIVMPVPVTATTANEHSMTDEIRRAIREELAASVIPAVKQAFQEAVGESLIRPIQSSISELVKQGIQVDHDKIAASLSQSIDAPFRAAFANSMRTVLVPALESTMGQVLQQVSEHLEEQSNGHAGNREIEALSAQLSTMTDMVAKLNEEFHAMRNAISARQPEPAAAVPDPVEVAAEQLRNKKMQIEKLCLDHQYEQAFSTAFTHPSPELTLFCCSKADLDDVFEGSTPKVAQIYLVCIIQHLAQTIRTSVDEAELHVALKWLNEALLSLNPPAPDVREPLPRVLMELGDQLTARIERNDVPHRQRDFSRLGMLVRGFSLS